MIATNKSGVCLNRAETPRRNYTRWSIGVVVVKRRTKLRDEVIRMFGDRVGNTLVATLTRLHSIDHQKRSCGSQVDVEVDNGDR